MSDDFFQSNPTILVVDDEELMREVVTIMIEENGGSVISAVDGQDAIEKFEEHASDISCVFMDFSMPRKNGYEAYVEIRNKSAEVPVVIVSGLSVTPEVEELKKNNQIVFLSKPFHEEQLLGALQAASDLK